MIIRTQAISPHSYVKLLWERIPMRAHERGAKVERAHYITNSEVSLILSLTA